MKATIQFFALASFLAISFFTSCQKTEDLPDLALLADKEWRLVSISESGNEISDSCDLDDILLLSSSSFFAYDFGELFCEDLGQENLSGDDWRFDEDGTVIRMNFRFRDGTSFGSIIEYWEIMALSENELIVRDFLGVGNGQIPEVRRYEW
jgi:hypothetical protein